MTERILFHPDPTVAWLKGLKVETLGRIPKGTWLAADDAVALELLKRDRMTLMLYPTREEYQEAIEGLDEAERGKAVALRQEILGFDPKSFSLPDFSGRSLAILSMAASGSEDPGPAGAGMRQAFKRHLGLIQVYAGGEDEGGSGKVPLLDGMLEPLNTLNWEERVLGGHVGDALPSLDAALQASRKSLVLAIQQAMRRLGAKYEQEPTGEFLADLARGVFASPLDTTLVKGIRSSREPVLEWKDGFVCVWKESGFDHFPMQEKKKRILYFNARAFESEFRGLTAAQVRMSFEKRSRQPIEGDAREYLAQLKLSALLALRKKLAAVGRFDAKLSESMATQAELETASLRALLAAYPIWRAPKTHTPEDVKAAAASEIKDMEFWNGWVSAKQWHEQQADVERFLAALKEP